MRALQIAIDQQTLQGLRDRDGRAYELLYAFYYPIVERWVLRNGGGRAAAQDVFQDTVLALQAKADDDACVLTCLLKTYVVAIANNLWLKRLRDERRLVQANAEEMEQWAEPAAPDAFAREGEGALLERARQILRRVSPRCQALLQALFVAGQTLQAFAAARGYTTVHNARNQKYKCLEQARREARAA